MFIANARWRPVFLRQLVGTVLTIIATVMLCGCSIDLGYSDSRYGVFTYVKDQSGQTVRQQFRVVGIPVYAHNVTTNAPTPAK